MEQYERQNKLNSTVHFSGAFNLFSLPSSAHVADSSCDLGRMMIGGSNRGERSVAEDQEMWLKAQKRLVSGPLNEKLFLSHRIMITLDFPHYFF